MWIVGAATSLCLILLILIDAFETILQPRRVTHRFRFARLFYRSIWTLWRGIGLRIRQGKPREAFLSVFGPLSLLGLLSLWAFGLIFGFALLHWSLETTLHAPETQSTLWTYLYLSGTTFFTLGLGDVTPTTALGRALTVIQSGMGFAFLAVTISYLPVLSQAFSRREIVISQMDARAGSPPSGAECLIRLARGGGLASVDSLLTEWERWAAELLESHLSFPVLSYFRSQHDNQSWLTALVAILDASALLMAEVKNVNVYQARLTFAMARHAAVDLALVLKTPPSASDPDRLPENVRQRLGQIFGEAGFELHHRAGANARLAELRGMYEPFVNALAQRFLITIPPMLPTKGVVDNWQTSAWMPQTPGIDRLHTISDRDGHFD